MASEIKKQAIISLSKACLNPNISFFSVPTFLNENSTSYCSFGILEGQINFTNELELKQIDYQIFILNFVFLIYIPRHTSKSNDAK